MAISRAEGREAFHKLKGYKDGRYGTRSAEGGKGKQIRTDTYLDAAMDLAEAWKVSVEWIERGSAFRSDYLPEDNSEASREKRLVRAVIPARATDFGVFCHELAHMIIDPVADEPESWTELRATLGALDIFDRLGFPDRDQVTWRLGRALNGYLETDFREGKISKEEIERRLPEELLKEIDVERFGIWRPLRDLWR
jgi:hypothetical protein